jgi:hypothetical protein
LLIPQGARLVGNYDSVVAFGQKRALVIWQRIVMPDGSSLRIDNMPATDLSGYAGLEDKADFHTWQLIKGVALPAATAEALASHFLSNAQAAAFLNLSPRTPEKLRVVGGGPQFRKFGRRVMFDVNELEAWAAMRRCDSTSDPTWKSAQRNI